LTLPAVEAPLRLVVVAPNWLGDAVLALPAIASLRQWHPAVHLTVAARPSVAPLFSLVDGVDAVLTLGRRGRWRDVLMLASDARALANGAFGVAVLLPNSFHAAWLVRIAGIPERWGYRADLRARLLTRAIAKPVGLVHQTEYYLRLVHALGTPRVGLVAALRLAEDDRRRAEDLLRRRGWDGAAIIGFAPGAAFGLAKRWPPDRVAAVAAALARKSGMTPVLVGTSADRATTRAVRRAFRRELGADARLIDLVGQTDLRTLVAVLTMCTAVVSNDSGAMHVAAAAGVPVTAIFGPTDERRTAPLPHPSGAGTAIVGGRAWCRPCELRGCPLDHRCMTSISVERVVEATEQNIAVRRKTRDGWA
jgi:heptosyltransferase-2